VKLIVNYVLVIVFAVVRNSARLVQSYHTDEPSAPFLSSAVDQVSQELTNNNTPASSDVEILPPKFLNRNPRYSNTKFRHFK